MPQELFDRLPESLTIRSLAIRGVGPPDLAFLPKLKNLAFLKLQRLVDAETIRKILEELKFPFMLELELANQDGSD